MGSFHNTSPRMIQCLKEAGIDHVIFANYLNHVLANCPAPQPQSKLSSFEFNLCKIQVERLILLTTS
jgi:hypothetical protein